MKSRTELFDEIAEGLYKPGQEIDLFDFAEEVWQQAINHAYGTVEEQRSNMNFFGNGDIDKLISLGFALDRIEKLKNL